MQICTTNVQAENISVAVNGRTAAVPGKSSTDRHLSSSEGLYLQTESKPDQTLVIMDSLLELDMH